MRAVKKTGADGGFGRGRVFDGADFRTDVDRTAFNRSADGNVAGTVRLAVSNAGGRPTVLISHPFGRNLLRFLGYGIDGKIVLCRNHRTVFNINFVRRIGQADRHRDIDRHSPAVAVGNRFGLRRGRTVNIRNDRNVFAADFAAAVNRNCRSGAVFADHNINSGSQARDFDRRNHF